MPADARHAVGGEVRGERPQDRDAAADRRLEPERRPVPPRERLERRAVMGDDVLVGGHDRLAGPERGGDERVRRLVAAHELDDDVDVGSSATRCAGASVEQVRRAGRDRAALATSRTATADQLEGAPSAGRSSGGPVVEQGAATSCADRPGARGRRRAAGRGSSLGIGRVSGIARW